jgi:single-strand DNA-binding protein
MADLNLVQLMGRLTADPELRRIPSGSAVTELRMAVNKSFKTRDGEKREEVLYVDVTLWEKTAEIACQYLRKGSPVYVQGSLKMDEWDDKTTGEKRSKIKVNGDSFQFLESRPRDEGGNGGGYQNQRQAEPQRPQGRPSAPPAGRGGYSGQGGRGTAPPVTQREVDEYDDSDIPF